MTIQITYKPLHPTFAAEATVHGTILNKATPELAELIKQGMAKYGVLVFRKTGLDDESHIALSRLLGELDDMTPYVEKGRKLRLNHLELFDVSNIGVDNEIYSNKEGRGLLDKGNFHFHTDSSFNARRAGLSLLLAHEIPPPGTGGETEFADSRTAYADLPPETREQIKDYVCLHTQHWSRRKASPGEPKLLGPEYDPVNFPMSRHKMVQVHEPSGRTNLYIASHVYSIEGKDHEASMKEIDPLLDHVAQPKYVVKIGYENPLDLVIWDNTCVQHRATAGTYAGKFRRDVRRTTVHDMGTQAWGLNGDGSTWRIGMP